MPIATAEYRLKWRRFLQIAQELPPREAIRLAAINRLATLRRQKTLWRADLPTFGRDGLKIRPTEGALVPFVFNSVQMKLHAALENLKAEHGYIRAIVLKARQMGVSTYVGGASTTG